MMQRLQRDRATMIRPRAGQIVLGVVLVGVILTIVGSAFFQAQSNEVERQSVFAEEADGTALTFVQRESFGVLLALDEWTRGDATARDVQIARAVLGQRLGVVTMSGNTTFDLTDQAYQDALAALDVPLLELSDVPDADRVAFRSSIDGIEDEFASASRGLSQVFQDILRAQTQAALDDRVRTQTIQGILSLIALAMGAGLFTWIAVDINRGYRASANTLAAQTARLERTRERLILLQRIDERGRGWLQAANAGAPRDEVFETITREIAEIVPGLVVEAAYDYRTPIRVVSRPESALDDGDDDALIARAVETVRLVITRDSGEEELAFQRVHDALTGLPNRAEFDALVDARVSIAAESDAIVAVMLIDIDRFTDLNSSLGTDAGDALLLAVARTLRRTAAAHVHVARLSSDEFGVVGVFDSSDDVHAQAEAITSALDFEWEVAGMATRVTVSSGLAVHGGELSGAILVQRAAAAIQLAKSKGERAAFVLFDDLQHGRLLTTMLEESAIRAAIRAGEFIMHFQPVIELATGAVAGVEALVRWERPGVGLVPPDEFLPAVARAGLGAELGWEVIDQSLAAWGRQLELHPSTGGRPYVAINVDPAQLDLPDLADYVIAAARRHGVPAECVVIEVTERALAGSELAIDQLTRLRAAGIRIALDDFGTGYSSLSQASSLPLDVLKIDRSFLPGESLLDQNRRLVGDICAIAATLGLRITAEGVETESVAEDLRALGVDYAQGWLYSRGLPERELTTWMRSWRGESELTAR